MKNESKKKYNEKLYNEAKLISCGCGCGEQLKEVNKHGRKRMFINGHNNRKYDDKTQYKREWNHKNRKSRYDYNVKYIDKRKNDMILFKGGECCECHIKYDGSNQAIFDFHHINPTKKEFNLNKATICNTTIKKVYNELEKCKLVCSNCHRMIHFKKGLK